MTAAEKSPRSWGRQIIRFLLSGGAAALTDIGTFSLLTGPLDVHPLEANLVSRPLGGLVSFALNKLWTFGHRSATGTGGQFLRYTVVWFVAYSLSEALIGLFYGPMGLSALPSKLLAEGLVGILTFLTHRFWTFRHR